MQGKEYVFVANSDNLGAVVDLSILILFLIVNCLEDFLFVILCSGFNDEIMKMLGIEVLQPVISLT